MRDQSAGVAEPGTMPVHIISRLSVIAVAAVLIAGRLARRMPSRSQNFVTYPQASCRRLMFPYRGHLRQNAERDVRMA